MVSGLVAFCGLLALAALGAGPAAAMQEMPDQAAAQVIVNWPPGKMIYTDCPMACCVCLPGESCNYAKATGVNTGECDPNQAGGGCYVDQRYRVCATWYWFTGIDAGGACLKPSGNLYMYRQKMNDFGTTVGTRNIHDPC